MKIVVCAKQIPDPNTPYTLNPETHFIDRPAEQVLDDTDRYGVEVALQIGEKAAGEVVVVSMGPSGGMRGIRQALAMGADRAIVVDDPALRGSGALVTAKVLAAAIRSEEPDLVIAGTESTDGYAGVVPQQLAELLGLPALTYARRVEYGGGTIRIERMTTVGYDIVEAELPVLVTVTSGVAEPRYPSFKGIMAANTKRIDQPLCADLHLSAGQVGIDGSAQKIIEVRDAPERQAGRLVVDEGEAHLEIVSLLEQAKVI